MKSLLAPINATTFILSWLALLSGKILAIWLYLGEIQPKYIVMPLWALLSHRRTNPDGTRPENVIDTGFELVLLIVSILGLLAGLLLLFKRMRAIKVPPYYLTLYCIPLLDMILTFLLINNDNDLAVESDDQERYSPTELLKIIGFQSLVLICMVMVFTQVTKAYTIGLFIGLPFFSGYLCQRCFDYVRLNIFVVALIASLSGSFVLFIGGLEGLICLIMLFPVYYVACLIGAFLAKDFKGRRPTVARLSLTSLWFALIVIVPDLIYHQNQESPNAATVVSEVYIDAPREVVWQSLCNFKTIEEEPGWLFKLGVAHPISARMMTDSLGRKVRHCMFTTGPFVEPITLEIKDSTLAFYVQSQPLIMEEVSPYKISPAHLDDYVRSERGQFLLVKHGKGTILKGTTWYTSKIEPFFYWKLWCDYIIHDIHLQVLRQIERQSLAAVKGS